MARLTASVVLLTVAATGLSPQASAQSITDDGSDSLPGSHRVGFAEEMSGVASFAAATGYGGRSGTLGMDDSHHRAIGSIAGNWRARPWLAVGMRLEGRYDKHTGLAGTPSSDDSWVGDPRLFVRACRPLGPKLYAGVHAGLWFPSESALSFDGASPELRGLASYTVSDEWAVATNLGFRLDRSASTVKAPDQLSAADRLALGVSDANAVLLGAAARWRRGKLTVVADWSMDLLVGGQAPKTSASPMRIGTEARWRLGETLWLRGGLEVSLAATPSVAQDAPLAPVEPRATAWIGVGYHFSPSTQARKLADDDDPQPPDSPQAQFAVVQGVVVDASGVPIAGASVTIGDKATASAADGKFTIDQVAVGDTTLTASADGFVEAAIPVAVEAPTTVARVQLLSNLPPGQIRGFVRTLSGRPIAGATVRVEPLGVEATVNKRGEFRIDVPPGTYSVVFSARKHREQTRKVLVEQDGVTVLNVELRRGRR